MYYFQCAPNKYRKILFVLKDERNSTGESLADYYVRAYGQASLDITPQVGVSEQKPDIDQSTLLTAL